MPPFTQVVLAHTVNSNTTNRAPFTLSAPVCVRWMVFPLARTSVFVVCIVVPL